MTILKAGTAPLSDIAEFLQPFAALMRRPKSLHAMERYSTGLLSDLPRKTASEIGRSIAGTNEQRLQEFLTRTSWDPKEMDRLRIQHMVSHVSVGEGVQIIDDTGFAKSVLSMSKRKVLIQREWHGSIRAP